MTFELDGYTFHYDDRFVWVKPGELHPVYVLYAECAKSEDSDLWGNRRMMAAMTILHKKDQWSKDADNRGGMPPGFRGAI